MSLTKSQTFCTATHELLPEYVLSNFEKQITKVWLEDKEKARNNVIAVFQECLEELSNPPTRRATSTRRPPAYETMVTAAIKNMMHGPHRQSGTRSGVSRQAIFSYIRANYPIKERSLKMNLTKRVNLSGDDPYSYVEPKRNTTTPGPISPDFSIHYPHLALKIFFHASTRVCLSAKLSSI